MKKKMVVTILTLCMVLTLLPIEIANASEESGDNLKTDYNLTEILSAENAISYDDVPILFSLSSDQVKDYFPVENIRYDRDYFETVDNGTYSDGTTNWNYSLNVWKYGYGYTNSSGPRGNNFNFTTPAGGKEILYVDMGFGDPNTPTYGGPIGLRDILLGDSYAVVLAKLGLDTNFAGCMDIELHINADGDNAGWANRNTGLWENKPDEPHIRLYFGDSWQDIDSLYIEFCFLRGEQLNLVRYSNHKLLKQLIFDSIGQGSELESDFVLPSDKLKDITNTSSAIEAVSYLVGTMTSSQKTAPTCIDLVTLYAETASAKAAAKPTAGDSILIDATAVSDLGLTAVEASEAVEMVLTNGGVTTARYLSKTIILTTDEQDISIQIDPDILTTEIDRVRVETPTYAVTLKLADLEPDLTQPLTFTAQDVGAGYAAGSSISKAAVKVGLPNGRTTNSITVSLPSDSGDTTYQAVVSTDGQATASKYNPATTTMDGKINTSGTYTVKSNEKDFTDISGKSAEMQKAIRYLASRGIISGTTATTFSPDGSINRAEIATLLVKALGKLDSTATASFSDVTKGNWFYTAAASSQRHKLINGYEDNTFRGTTNISKVQIVAVSIRVLKTEMGYKEPASPATYLSKYSDAIDSWAQSEVALATKENLVVYRTDGTFSGDKNMTRGDAAIIIYRLFQRIW